MKEKIKIWMNKAGSFFQWSAWTDKAGKFLKSGKGIACMAAAGVLALAAAAWGGYEIWLSGQPKFHDLTIELGTDPVQNIDLFTEYPPTYSRTSPNPKPSPVSPIPQSRI